MKLVLLVLAIFGLNASAAQADPGLAPLNSPMATSGDPPVAKKPAAQTFQTPVATREALFKSQAHDMEMLSRMVDFIERVEAVSLHPQPIPPSLPAEAKNVYDKLVVMHLATLDYVQANVEPVRYRVGLLEVDPMDKTGELSEMATVLMRRIAVARASLLKIAEGLRAASPRGTAYSDGGR